MLDNILQLNLPGSQGSRHVGAVIPQAARRQQKAVDNIDPWAGWLQMQLKINFRPR